MSAPKPTVLLLTDRTGDIADVTVPLAAAAFHLRTAPQDATESWFPADAPPPVCVAVVVGRPEFALAATRRVRAETSPSPLPVLWLLDVERIDWAAAGLEAGADVCLVRPTSSELLAAQVNALRRVREQTARFATRGTDVGELAGRLQKAFRQSEEDAAFARRITAGFTPESPLSAGSLTATLTVHPPAYSGHAVDLYRVGSELRFVACEVSGMGLSAGTLLAEVVTRSLIRELCLAGPGPALTAVNRRLRALTLADAVVVSAAAGKFDERLAFACAGWPAPVHQPMTGDASTWHGSGPFLGTAEVTFAEVSGELAPGDMWQFQTGTKPADPPVPSDVSVSLRLKRAEMAGPGTS